MRVGGFEPRAISGSVSPSLGRYESWRARAWGDTGSAGLSPGRYGSPRARAWGDMGVGGFEPGAISESDGSSLGRYRGRHFRLVVREDAWSYAVRGAERRACRSGDRRSKPYVSSTRISVARSAALRAAAGLKTGGPSRTGLPRDQRALCARCRLKPAFQAGALPVGDDVVGGEGELGFDGAACRLDAVG